MTADRLYEITLLLSFVLGAIALALALFGRGGGLVGTGRWVRNGAVAAWVALLVSVTVHLRWGHTPGGPQALPPVEFVREHGAFVAAALIPGLALVTRRRASGSEAQEQP